MGQYMLLLVGRGAQPQATDAETQDYNARWMEYFGGLARSGVLRAGAPFAATGKIVQGGTVSGVNKLPMFCPAGGRARSATPAFDPAGTPWVWRLRARGGGPPTGGQVQHGGDRLWSWGRARQQVAVLFWERQARAPTVDVRLTPMSGSAANTGG